MKKVLLYVLSIMMIFGFYFTNASAKADHKDDKVYNNEWYYHIYNSKKNKKSGYRYNEIWITGYKGTKKNVVIPAKINGKKVTGISEEAFFKEDFTKVTISKGIKIIDASAFAQCNKLKKIVLPSGLVEIGEGAFGCCVSLKKIKLPESLKIIWDSAFNTCTSLSEIKLPTGLKRIYAGAFYGSGLKTVTIPQNTGLDEFVFSHCNSLQTVVFSKGRKTIDGEALFCDCKKLKSVTIPDSLENGLRAYDFMNCKKLQTIKISAVNKGYKIVNGVIMKKDLSSVVMCLPASEVTEYIADEATKTIEGYAFYGCTKLEKVDLGNVESIGEASFWGCSSLTSIVIPSSVAKLSESFLKDCPKLKTITINSKIKLLPDLSECSSLEEINISDDNENYCSVNGVVMNKDKTELIRCPEGKSGEYQVPDTVTSIGEKAFYQCGSLKKVDLNQVKTIKFSAFGRCSAIEEITIPASVENIDGDIFNECRNLKNITVSEGNTKFADIEGVLTNKDKTRLIKCPDSYKGSSYTVPESIKTIAASAFVNCINIKTVTIGKTVTKIEPGAFSPSNTDYTKKLIIKAPKGSKAYKYAQTNKLLK